MATRNKQDCHSCEAESFSRNNYFTGKLMVERDFTDEQRYFMEKIRLHHQRLHGSGVVCGLQLGAHEEPCDDRYVMLQPGSAVDCCGKDILVTDTEVIDLYAFPAMQELITAAEDEENPEDIPTHRLQLCIKYRECPGEDIPVLYDECGCDDTQCAPNRILESYDIDLLIDAETVPQRIIQPAFDWHSTVNVAHAEQVYLHEASNRLYVLTADDAGIVYQVSTDNFSVEASYALGRRGLALTTNETGDELYVVVADAGGIAAGDAELWAFDVTATNLASGSVRDAVIAGSDNSTASALRLADGRLALLFHSGGRLRLWDAGLAAPMTPANTLDTGIDLYGLSAASTAQFVYSAEPGSTQLHLFDMNAADFAPLVINGVADATVDRVSGVHTVISSAADLLLVLDDVNNSVRLVDPAAGGTVLASVALAYQPVDVAISNGAHWAYVLVRDGDDAYVQSINLHSLLQGNAVTAGTPSPVGDVSRGVTITSTADRLFIPYIDDLTVDNAGGVAVIHIDEASCHDLLWPDDCPECESSDCLVLATIENYRPGFRVLDMPVPAPDPLTDLADAIARIDNNMGRKRLPSTQAIVAALECMLDNCCGGAGGGEQGPPGMPGAPGVDGAPGAPGTDGEDGRSISQVEVDMVPCDQPASGQVTEIGSDELRLSLEIPGNCNPDLAHLCNINWWHGGEYTAALLNEQGLLQTINDLLYFRFRIRFDQPVRADDLHRQSIRISVQQYLSAMYQNMELNSLIVPGMFDGADCEFGEFNSDGRIDTDYVNGAEILLDTQWISLFARNGFVMRFSIHGDFIRDRDDRGSDLEHLPLWLSNQDPAQATAEHTGDGVPGGEFVSWLSFRSRSVGVIVGDHLATPVMATIDSSSLNQLNNTSAEVAENVRRLLTDDRIAINSASMEELTAINGVGPELAEAIVNARASEPIRDETALMKIPGIGKSLMAKIRKQILFDDGV